MLASVKMKSFTCRTIRITVMSFFSSSFLGVKKE